MCFLLSLVSVLGVIWEGIVGILWLDVLLLRLRFILVLFSRIGGLFLILLFGPLFFTPAGLFGFLSLLGVLHFGLLLGCLLLIRLGVLGLLRFRGFGKFMTKGFSLCLGRMLWDWMRHFYVVMSLVLGWFGPLQLRRLLRMLFSLLGDLSCSRSCSR